jgi:hypothetical protein
MFALWRFEAIDSRHEPHNRKHNEIKAPGVLLLEGWKNASSGAIWGMSVYGR